MAARIFLISDTHFYHANILTFTDSGGKPVRPEFSNVKDMNDHMIERWNSVVKPEDHIYHLGDLTMERGSHARAKVALAFVKNLNGHKRLVLGNHDHFDVRDYREAGFQKIYGCHNLNGILLTHIPVHPMNIGRFAGNAHGHIHERNSPPGPYYNCSVEKLAYTPVEFDEVMEQLKFLKAKWDEKSS